MVRFCWVYIGVESREHPDELDVKFNKRKELNFFAEQLE